MSVPALGNGPVDYIDILGQQPGLSIYTQISMCFPVADASSDPDIISTLTSGLERLSTSFPWVAGHVVNEGAGEGNTGIFKIATLEKIPRLVVKDLRDDPSVMTMAVIRQANFPINMLDESIVAPRRTIPSPEEAALEKPVLIVQATFITGGLILTFLGQHQVMDMTGQGQIIHLLSKACRNEPFTSEELASGNRARHDIIPFLDDSYQLGDELVHQTVKPAPPPIEGAAPLPPPKATWANFSFPPASLAALKSLASQTVTSGYISTDDALCALIWQSVLRARLPRLDPIVESTFARAVDVRRYLDIPQTYPGIVQSMSYHTYTLQTLLQEPLGAVASILRAAVDPKTSNLAHNTRALATCLHRSPDKNIISFTAMVNLSTDIMLSSWGKINCYQLDFGLGLGNPEAVRRPRFDTVESLMYILPRTPDGEIAAAICLRDEDMERLKADEEFGKYGKYVG
ncbi:hypothetical protein C0991_008983 [Blastosporella zonata]|nr:hypothetical protein C0991_008983 [Blastosporella zonata]